MMQKGRRLALDYGLVRIGVAVSDPDGQFVFPITSLESSDWESGLDDVITEYHPVAVYIGYPITLTGNVGSAANLARDFAIEVSEKFQGPIRLIDERLSTKNAAMNLREAGKSEKESRKEIDAVAASILLEKALMIEKNTGQLAGSEIT
jgi:putative Holliday junction resolvase